MPEKVADCYCVGEIRGLVRAAWRAECKEINVKVWGNGNRWLVDCAFTELDVVSRDSDTAERVHFERCALASGLVTREKLDEARAAVRWSDGRQYNVDAPPTRQQLIDEVGMDL